MLPKVRITRKKASIKSCSELNFVQKSPQVDMSICLRSGARGLERLKWLKSDVELKQQIKINYFKNMILFHISIKFFQN